MNYGLVYIPRFQRVGDVSHYRHQTAWETGFIRFTQKPKQKQITLGYNLPGRHRVFTRKAGYHYGWDWGPSFATSGIWKSVELIGYDNWRVKSIHIHQEKVTKQKADLIIKVDIESFIDSDAVLTISELSKGINTSESIFLSKGLNIINKKMFINDPDLWWPIGHGGQNLYDFNIVFETRGYNQTIRKRVGLRDFRVDQKIDHAGTGFTFVINGKPIYSKGANWIPADFFTTRLKKEDYYRLLKSAVSANMNTLRVWGGGIYESEHFYNICDEMGILVWQDFMFSCALYPGDKEFLKSVEKEARFQVSRLKDHPSIILWCGNNEIAWAWHNWGWKDRFPEKLYYNDYKSLFHNVLPSVCNEFDSNRLYWPSSPGDNDMLPTVGQQFGSGDNHYWGVWHGGDGYPLLLMHGAGPGTSAAGNFAKVREPLAKRYEVYGTDKELVNHVSALINDLGKSVTVVDNHADLKGGNTIILCGDDWSAFCSAAKVNEANQSLVVQFEHDHHHEQGGHGFTTGAHNIRYTLGENKAKVAKRVAPRL